MEVVDSQLDQDTLLVVVDKVQRLYAERKKKAQEAALKFVLYPEQNPEAEDTAKLEDARAFGLIEALETIQMMLSEEEAYNG
jgi:hypothetical protein